MQQEIPRDKRSPTRISKHLANALTPTNSPPHERRPQVPSQDVSGDRHDYRPSTPPPTRGNGDVRPVESLSKSSIEDSMKGGRSTSRGGNAGVRKETSDQNLVLKL